MVPRPEARTQCPPAPLTEPRCLCPLQLASGVNAGQGLGIEIIATLQLVLCVLATTDRRRRDLGGSAPLAIGLSVALGHLLAVSGGGVERAVRVPPVMGGGRDPAWALLWGYRLFAPWREGGKGEEGKEGGWWGGGFCPREGRAGPPDHLSGADGRLSVFSLSFSSSPLSVCLSPLPLPASFPLTDRLHGLQHQPCPLLRLLGDH